MLEGVEAVAWPADRFSSEAHLYLSPIMVRIHFYGHDLTISFISRPIWIPCDLLGQLPFAVAVAVALQ